MTFHKNYPQGFRDKRTVLDFKKKTHLAVAEDYYALNWSDLHELRSSVQKACDKILGFAESEKRDLADDETRAFDFGIEVIDAISEEFRMREAAGTKDPLFTGKPNEIVNRAPTDSISVDSDGNIKEARIAPASNRTFRSLFLDGRNDKLDNKGFRSFREFMNVALSGRYDPRLEGVSYRTQVEFDGVSGGFAIPTEYSAMLMDQTIEKSIVLSRASIFPMATRERVIPAFDSANHSSSLFGGFTGAWVGEGDASTVQTAQLRQIKLSAKKMLIRSNASREVLEDAVMFRDRLQESMITAAAAYLDQDFITGSGVGRPLGILNNPSIIAYSRSTANQISYSDLRGMYSRLHPTFHKNAVWLVSTDAVPQLMSVTDSNNNLIWMPGRFGTVATEVPQTLFGIEVIITEKVPTLGSKGDICLVDLTQYGVGLRQEFIIESSNAVNWANDLTDFRVIVRADGQGLWDKAITPMNGGSTLSWAVALDIP